MEGLLFDIKRFAIHDGPGIRTTVFFKGCPLNCWWCHNPESQSGRCESFDKAENLGNKKFRIKKTVGEYFTIDQVLIELEKQKIFMQQGNGGVTLSGGEPLMQSDFASELLYHCKKNGWHTVLDTTGYTGIEIIKKVAKVTHLFLYDIKLIDKVRHKKFTGVDNTSILDNFRFLVRNGSTVVVRLPLIPGVNTDDNSINDFLNFLTPLKNENFNEIHILPYHHIGQSKYPRFNREFKMQGTPEPDEQLIQLIANRFNHHGFKTKIERY